MAEEKTPIPIKNLFFLLCYAWDVLAISNAISVSEEECDNALNLLARLFSFGVSKLIRSGFHRSYIKKTEDTSSPRGKILLRESLEDLATHNGHLVCEFDEYSQNDVFNGIIVYTIDKLIHTQGLEGRIRQALRKHLVFFDGIDSVQPTKDNRRRIVFNRNNVTYKLLLSIAFMLYDNTSVNEDDGYNTFRDFFREEQMSKVFEKFILNFYACNLPRDRYRVHAPKINWHISEEAQSEWGDIFDIDTNPGDRRTDIVVEDNKTNTQIIMDAKYYEKTFVKAYMDSNEEKIRTSHLNQVRGYVLDSEYQGSKIGVLVYPMVVNDLNKGKMFPIKGSHIIVKTINLADDWRNIEKDMLGFVSKFEKKGA